MNTLSEHRPTVAIISAPAIRHNIKKFQKQLAPHQQLYAVVKANAYGHGSVGVAQIAQEQGVDGFAVATVDEAIELRQSGINLPILVLGLCDPRGIAEVLYYDVTVTVSDLTYFERAHQQLETTQQSHLLDQYRLKFHLALDTGMGRIGLNNPEEIQTFVDGVGQYVWADWVGVFTHLATSGGGPQAYIQTQMERWQAWQALIPDSVTLRHFANSATGLWSEEAKESDIVRLGIAMYGIDPKDQRPTDNDLQAAFTLVSELAYVKQIKAGMSVSYGASYTASQDEWVGTVPIGYADGWLRHYQEIPVLVQGHACPILGVINMDQLMIRLPGPVPVGTTVTLIGKDGHEENHVSEMAQQLNTIGYEILTSINDRVPRIYMEDEDAEGSSL